MTVLLDGQQRWECPNCPATAVTVGAPNRFHHCTGLGGLWTPLVLVGTRCKVTAVVREDWIRGEQVHYDGVGRPISAVVTTRDDGTDTVVYAATAQSRGIAHP